MGVPAGDPEKGKKVRTCVLNIYIKCFASMTMY